MMGSMGGMGGPPMMGSMGGMGGPPPMMGGGAPPPMMGAIPSHMGPMTGFGPSILPKPELRHAPQHQKPENAEMDEDQKNVTAMPIRLPDGETLASGSKKFILYGALEDEANEDMLDQQEKLGRRRRVNCVPALNALFLPWVLFLVVFSLSSFKLHYVLPAVVTIFNTVVTLAVFAYAYMAFTNVTDRPEKAFYPTYLSIAFLTAVTFGWLIGDLNFWFNMQPCYNIEHLATYNNVNPSTSTLRSGQVVPTRGKRYQDAGKVYFDHDSIIDVDKSMSFKMGDLYCVAPIVNPNCKKNCGYDFWAVGTNCCAEDVSDFRCGQYNNPSAKAGLRLMHDELRPNFRLAVLEAEGVHKIVSTHPVFFYWVHDPVKEMAHVKHQGFRLFVVLMIVSFFGYGAAAFFCLNWARQAFKPAR